MVEIFQNYVGTGMIVALFLVALVYLFLCEKDKNKRILFVYTPVIVLLLFFNPLFYRIFYEILGSEIYFRIIWLLPLAVVVAYAVVHMCVRLQGKVRTGFALICAVVLILSGKLVYSSPLYSPAENTYHVPQKVVDICDAIEVEGREVMAAFPTEFLLYVRQYTQGVCMPYGRTVLMGYYDDFHGLIMSEEIQVEELAQMAKASKCHYVILPEKTVLIGDMEAFDYEVFDSMHGYVIYVDNSIYRGL
ncbi:MAG: hypothetical protein E7293_00370 [Lachnospiraceae bacterium]|nr:hypothetical protein [Lachnospiraceae bacterium]